ncbi:RNA polymerase sigma factor [Kribbella catacumbae]|uniref:RNA polymerase sigma factor n=1 Tax=Kribbella catacumbae TaxID=460086 RepID=UPI00037B28DE|nr:sigma-70 family RNA polymerase sigma factor [Kribbella catacumbae]
MTQYADVAEAVAHAHRHEWARVLAATVRVARDLDLAEECTQDAYTKALSHWAANGVPDRPGAWLTTVARNRARDLLRRESVLRSALPLLVMDDVAAGPEDVPDPQEVADDLLRLIFTCCHPALSRDAQVALTLRLVCGLSTTEVARAFLVQDAAMAARITRAKKKISAARIPYRVPDRAELPARVDAVLEVVHLVFTTGHAAPFGSQLVRRDLVDGAIRLARNLRQLLPGSSDVAGLLALLLLTDSRRDTRLSDSGELVLLAEQDRTRWDAGLIEEGAALLTEVLRSAGATRYSVQAAIVAVHTEAATWEDTDWVEVAGLYDVLRRLWPSPVVELNRAVAIGYRDGPEAGLEALSPLQDEPALSTYGYLSAARADFLSRLGRWADAATSYEEALAMTGNEVERAFLARRLEEVLGHLD